VTRDIRGLCAGDVNGTYVPVTGYKTAEPGLSLVNRGMLPVSDEIVFPVRALETHGSASLPTTIGAITLFMDYDPLKIAITGVEIPGYNGEQPSFETRNGVLYIGWVSTESIRVEHEGTLLLIHARLTEEFRISHFDPDDLNVKREMRNVKCKINFTLNENPLSELADSEGNVIGGLKLSIPDAGENSEIVKWRDSEIHVYPNPARDVITIEILTDRDGLASIELVNMQGISVLKNPQIMMQAGLNREKINSSGLMPGVYMLKFSYGEVTTFRKIIVRR
jgi:hypothetical protein